MGSVHLKLLNDFNILINQIFNNIEWKVIIGLVLWYLKLVYLKNNFKISRYKIKSDLRCPDPTNSGFGRLELKHSNETGRKRRLKLKITQKEIKLLLSLILKKCYT